MAGLINTLRRYFPVKNHIRTKSHSFRNLIVIFVLALLCTALLPGCAGPTPDKVVANYFSKIYDGDFTGAKKYCTDKFNNTYMAGADSMQQMMANMPDKGDKKLSISEIADMLTMSIEGDTAKVWARDFAFTKYVLVKQGSSWKIDDMEMDLGGMMDSLKDMGLNMPTQ